MEKNVKDLNYTDLAKMARKEAEAFATHIIGEAPTYRTGREVRYYENQSLRVNISGPKQGRFSSFADESARGDMIDLWLYVRGGTRHDAIVGYKSFAGIDTSKGNQTVKVDRGPSEEEVKKQADEDLAKRIRTANWIWNNASKTEGREEGLQYLRNRGITITPDSDLVRFRKLSAEDLKKMGIPKADIPETPVTSIIFKATDARGKITAVQQILTTDGKKLKTKNPKKTNGNMIGASVLLGEIGDDGKLNMIEGPETALSVFEATGTATMITLGKANFTNVHIPKKVKSLVIGSDMDASGTGLASSLHAAQHWAREGIEETGIALPRVEEGDFNDVHQDHGAEAISQAFNKAFFPVKTRKDEVVVVTPDARAAFHAWLKTGVNTAVRIPPVNKRTQKRVLNLDSAVEEHQKSVFLIGKKGVEIDKEYVEKHREDVKLIHVTDDSEEFLRNAKTDGYVEKLIGSVDIYMPQDIGKDQPLAVTLRRKDADALSEAGHLAIAVRQSEVDTIDFSFIKGRKAIIAPVGKGGAADQELEDQLGKAGADTTRLTWQIFRPTENGLEVVRNDIPSTYGAADAVAEGWKGPSMGHLLLISELNRAQIERKDVEEKAPKKKQLER